MTLARGGYCPWFALALATLLSTVWQMTAENLEARIKASPQGVTPLEVPGIHNLFALGTQVYSGSTPEGAEGFASLKRLGIKTIISVDGATPDVARAAKHGIRYVHLPHGYDGISTNLQLLLAKAGRELSGPIYVHCHHGKHRGPAAAAIICLADQGWTKPQAVAFLMAAGTATNYTGLYQAVRAFQNPTREQLRTTSAAFPEVAKVSGLVEAMVAIDTRWELLKTVRSAGYAAPKDHPDLQPANEALILWEYYREAQRLPEVTGKGNDLGDRFKHAEAEAREAERLLRLAGKTTAPDLKSQLDKAFDAMARSCSSCHKAHRDPARIQSQR